MSDISKLMLLIWSVGFLFGFLTCWLMRLMCRECQRKKEEDFEFEYSPDTEAIEKEEETHL